MSLRCDVLVLGTGAAGLTLAAQLATSTRRPRRVVLVDARDDPVAGRAWAYWSARHTVVDDAVGATWTRLGVHAAGRRLDLATAPYSYRLVRGEDLAGHVGALADRAGFTRLTGTVHELRPGRDRVAADVAGTVVEADWVLDGRPPAPPVPGQVRLRFLGWEVAADVPVFDPGLATFLDFAARAPGQVRFCYVLPTGSRRALVEVASFGAAEGGREDLVGALTGYLRDRWGLDSWRVLRQEAGDLALRRPGPRRHGRVLRVGAGGGMVKPSTGYGFDRMVRDAAAVAQSLDRFGHPCALPRRHRRHAWLDEVLLELIRDRPGAVEPAFARLFARNPTARVLRFLDEDTRPGQELRLIATLPPAPFVAAALALARGRRGRSPWSA